MSRLKKSIVFRLTRSYRSTKEIQAFCQALLIDPVQVESVNRSGELPFVTKIEKTPDLVPAIASAIQKIHEDGRVSVGIICKNTYQAKKLFADLKGHIEVNLVINENDEFHRGVIVIPSYLAKGLEFDAVLVINGDAINYSRQAERNILYTICTRALHHLSLFYIGKPSPFISEMEQDLYQILPSVVK